MTSEQGETSVVLSQQSQQFSQLPEVKSFIFGEFQTDYLRTSFTKIPGNEVSQGGEGELSQH